MTLTAVCIVQFMAPFMLTSVGVALPTLGRDFGASAMQLGLIEQLYVVSLAMGMLSFGRYGDIIGQRKVLLPGLALFTILTASIGLAQSVHMIMVQRFFQGLAACMMLSGSLALVSKAYPAAMRGRVIGVVSAFTYSGLSLGPTLGGYMTAGFGWRAVFLLSFPIGLAGFLVCLFGMKNEPPNAKAGRMDWRGSAAYAASVALFMLGAVHAGSMPYGPVMIAAGLAGLALFVLLQARTAHPLVDVRMLRSNMPFTLGSLAALGNYAATFGVTFSMSLYLQYVKGLTPQEAGGVLLIQPVLQIVVSPLIGRVADRTDPSKLACLGMLLSSAGLLLLAMTIGPDAPIWILGLELALVGAGFGVFITPNSTAVMGSVAPAQFGLASGMIASMRTLGMAVSMTSVTLIFSLFMGDAPFSQELMNPFLTSLRAGFSVFAVFSCLGLLISLARAATSGRKPGKKGGAA